MALHGIVLLTSWKNGKVREGRGGHLPMRAKEEARPSGEIK